MSKKLLQFFDFFDILIEIWLYETIVFYVLLIIVWVNL